MYGDDLGITSQSGLVSRRLNLTSLAHDAASVALCSAEISYETTMWS